MNPIQMNQVSEWNRMLSEMRQVKEHLAPKETSVSSTKEDSVSFGDFLSKAVSQVNDQMVHADGLSQSFEKGDPNVDLPDVMIAMQKANVGLQTTLQVRNKFVEAYKEIMNMPV